MDAPRLIGRLARFPGVLRHLVIGLGDDDARWRPEDGAWSILEVVCHLADEESEDFRTRLRLTLEDPAREWPPINPAGAATERDYNRQDLGQALRRFLDERAASLRYVRSLRPDTDWSIANVHPKFGAMHAGSLLGAWAAHDHLHVRQIGKRLYQLAARDAGAYPVLYAGDPPA